MNSSPRPTCPAIASADGSGRSVYRSFSFSSSVRVSYSSSTSFLRPPALSLLQSGEDFGLQPLLGVPLPLLGVLAPLIAFTALTAPTPLPGK